MTMRDPEKESAALTELFRLAKPGFAAGARTLAEALAWNGLTMQDAAKIVERRLSQHGRQP